MDNEKNNVISSQIENQSEDSASALAETAAETDTQADGHSELKSKSPLDAPNKKVKLMRYASFYFVLILLAFVRALGNYVFLVPNGFAPGGIGGLSTIIYKAVQMSNPQLAETVFNPGLTTLVMNIPLLIAAFVALNRKFAFNSLLVVGFYSGFMMLFSAVDFPYFYSADMESGLIMLASIAGGAMAGVGLGFMLRMNMSLAGTDIIGKLIYKRNPVADVQWIIFACDIVIVLASGTLGLLSLQKGMPSTEIMVLLLTPILYSFISLFVTSKVADIITTGVESSLVFQIITDNPEKLSEAIMHKTHRGVTMVQGEGYYTHEQHKMLICVIHKKQVTIVKRIVRQFDPNAFMFITTARQVTGKGFDNINDVE